MSCLPCKKDATATATPAQFKEKTAPTQSLRKKGIIYRREEKSLKLATQKGQA
jgi:hypothetical protein